MLSVEYQDDVLASSMNNQRRYTQTANSDGTISLTDATTYTQVGSTFGASDINATNAAIMGFVSQTTTFSTDGNTITEVDSVGRKRVTVIDGDTITEALYNASGTSVGTKTTTFNSDGSVSEVAAV